MRKLVVLNNILNHINFIIRNFNELSNYYSDPKKIKEYRHIYLLEMNYYYMYIILYIYKLY